MKKFAFHISKIFALLTIFSSIAFAQNTDGKGGIIGGGSGMPKGFPIHTDSTVNMDLPTYRERIFGALDLSPANIPSGCLMEYSLFGWDKTKNTLASPADSVNSPDVWFRLYALLRKAAVNSATSLPHSADSLQHIAQRYFVSGDTIPAFVLNHAYQTIRQNSYAEGCFTIDQDNLRLYDVMGRSTNPYATERLFAVGFFKTNFVANRAYRFHFPQSLWVGRTTPLNIDFGDGQGFRTVAPNSYVQVIYAQAGNRTIQVQKPNPATGGRTESFVVQITKIAVVPGAFQEIGNGVTHDFDWFLQSNYAYQGEKTSLHARVYLGCGGKLDRPVYILEGFDPNGEYGADDLFNDFYDLRDPATPNLPNTDFLRSLYTQGYDLIFVNWQQGNSAIEANALLLETLIEYTNSRCENLRQPGTVIGVSMGGLIARFALKSMEDKGKQHQVSNYFSYDSPHQGVFIPIGLQFILENLIEHFEGASVFFKTFANSIASANSVAAAQMMTVLYSRNPAKQAQTIAIRRAFAAKLEALGYPSQCQNHAIALGLSSGLRAQDFEPRTEILTAWANYALVNINLWAAASPAVGQTATVGTYTYLGIITPKLFGIFPYITLTLRFDWVRMTTPEILDNIYDNASGSSNTTQFRIADAFPAIPLLSNSGTNGNDFHTFVPAVSALDLRNQNYGQNDIWLSRRLQFNLVAVDSIIQLNPRILTNTRGSRLCPFNTYTNTSTLQHLTYLVDIMRYMHQIMAGSPNFILACFGLCQNNASAGITGTPVLCASTPSGSYVNSYTLGFNESVRWIFSSNLRPVVGGVNNNNRIDLELINPNDNTPQTVEMAVFNNTTNCSSLSNRMNVWVGDLSTYPSDKVKIRNRGGFANDEICHTSYNHFSVSFLPIIPGNPALFEYEWYVQFNNTQTLLSSGIGNSSVMYQAPLLPNGVFQMPLFVSVRIKNTCGGDWSSYGKTYTVLRSIGGLTCAMEGNGKIAQPSSIKAYPNPTADKLNLAFENLSSPVAQISVQNSLGVKVLETSKIDVSKENITSLDLGHLPDGLYVLTVVFENGERSNVKVVVQKGNIAN